MSNEQPLENRELRRHPGRAQHFAAVPKHAFQLPEDTRFPLKKEAAK